MKVIVIWWKVQLLPFVGRDPGLLKEVFAKLLATAVRFTSQWEQAVIEIGSRNGRYQPS